MGLFRRRPRPACERPESEEQRILRQRVQAVRRAEQDRAPYWCRTCGHTSHHERCWKCSGRCLARRTGMWEQDPFAATSKIDGAVMLP